MVQLHGHRLRWSITSLPWIVSGGTAAGERLPMNVVPIGTSTQVQTRKSMPTRRHSAGFAPRRTTAPSSGNPGWPRAVAGSGCRSGLARASPNTNTSPETVAGCWLPFAVRFRLAALGVGSMLSGNFLLVAKVCHCSHPKSSPAPLTPRARAWRLTQNLAGRLHTRWWN